SCAVCGAGIAAAVAAPCARDGRMTTFDAASGIARHTRTSPRIAFILGMFWVMNRKAAIDAPERLLEKSGRERTSGAKCRDVTHVRVTSLNLRFRNCRCRAVATNPETVSGTIVARSRFHCLDGARVYSAGAVGTPRPPLLRLRGSAFRECTRCVRQFPA